MIYKGELAAIRWLDSLSYFKINFASIASILQESLRQTSVKIAFRELFVNPSAGKVIELIH